MSIKSINPASGALLAEYKYLPDDILLKKLKKSHKTFQQWRKTNFAERKKLMLKVAAVLEKNKQKYGRIISLEMGKPYTQSVAEIEKSALLCRYYANNAARFLKEKTYKSDYSQSYAVYEPLGIVYAIMPWNFPFWQLFRCAVPALMAGNTVVLKHAMNVPQCALHIEEVFKLAGAPLGLFYNFFIDHELSPQVIGFPGVGGVSLTGSELAGSTVASQAGKQIKRTVLELGGSDPFIVLPDAELENAVKLGVTARMQNTGQSCIAAKRFIVHEKIAKKFIKAYVEQVKALKVGDPLHDTTDVGPLARKDLQETIAKQVEGSVKAGAKILAGGHIIPGNGFYYEPCVITDIPKDAPAYSEELFGPVASVFVVKDEAEAIELANDTTFGLGASIWSENIDHAKELAREIESGNVYINAIVKSDPRLPFGGTKRSGYGRELSDVGIHEFVNIKTIAIA